jgi:hypothetical protein
MTRQTLQHEEEPERSTLPKAANSWWVPVEVAEDLHALWRRPFAIRLRRLTPIERVVKDALMGRPPDPGGFDVLLPALNARGKRAWRSRITAAWLLGYLPMTDEQRREAGRALREALAQRDLVRRGALWAISAVFTQGIMVPIALMREWRRMQFQTAAVHSLGRLGEVESIEPVVGALLERRPFRRPAVRREAESALPALLSRLGPGDYGSVDAGTVRSLCALAAQGEETLALAALSALERVGGGAAAETVSLLSRDRRDHPALVAEAGRVLPVLLERKRLEDQASTLLRVAAAEEGSLLRPAGGASVEDETMLLRATDEVGR